ncbi:MAG: hypothetical protein ICV65_13045, partial [Flavisolibacter sp.]|nr:hypothetical protein [Flavisolibacter sp.]
MKSKTNQLTGLWLLLFSLFVIVSCKKEKATTPSKDNKPPVAKGGEDLWLTLSSCWEKTVLELDGSGSTDSDGKIVDYIWKTLRGPKLPVIRKSTWLKATVDSLTTGEYTFELTVTDEKNASSRDTVRIHVQGTTREYDFDVTVNGGFGFVDNESDCSELPCAYYDHTTINTSGTFLPLGEFTLSFSERSDTAASNYASESYFNFFRSGNWNSNVWGVSSVN